MSFSEVSIAALPAVESATGSQKHASVRLQVESLVRSSDVPEDNVTDGASCKGHVSARLRKQTLAGLVLRQYKLGGGECFIQTLTMYHHCSCWERRAARRARCKSVTLLNDPIAGCRKKSF